MQTIESIVRDTSDCVRNSYQQGLIGSVVSGIHITTTTATPTTDVDAATSSDALHSTDTPAAAVQRWAFVISQRYQHLLDKSTPFLLYRWIVFCVIAIIYTVHVLHLQGLYAVDPEFQDLSDGPFLPNRSSDEFRPFVRRLPEFKFWYLLLQFCLLFNMF
ncbi:putative retrieval of early ER protein Rer1 [Helianthus anomalus]